MPAPIYSIRSPTPTPFAAGWPIPSAVPSCCGRCCAWRCGKRRMADRNLPERRWRRVESRREIAPSHGHDSRHGHALRLLAAVGRTAGPVAGPGAAHGPTPGRPAGHSRTRGGRQVHSIPDRNNPEVGPGRLPRPPAVGSAERAERHTMSYRRGTMMGSSQWVRVSQGSPCPVCKSADWCSVSADGTVAKCMRTADGSFKSRQDKNGARYVLHRLAGSPRTHAPTPPRGGPEPQRADADTLDEVYSAFLSRLTLSEAHRENLLGRGLPDQAVEHNGYRTLPVQGRARIARELRDRFGDRLLRVPGFVVKEGD